MRSLFSKSPFTAAEGGLALLTALYVLAGWLTAAHYGLADRFKPLFYMKDALVLSEFLLLLYIVGWGLSAFRVMIFDRPPDLKKYLYDDLKQGPFNRERYVRALPVFVCFLFFFSAFTSLKFMIPGINPFLWDAYLADLDNILHGGTDPWRLLQPFLGHPYVTLLINGVYNLWLLILYLVLYWQLFSLKNPLLRMQFFYSFVLAWIVNGTILAIFFSSAGPCYYDLVVGSDRFMEQMEYLLGVSPWQDPIWSLDTQLKLWDHYISNKMGVGAGISAMPSVHVATAFLFMLLGFSTKKLFWKAVSFVYLVFIMLGSVHLGWHYAVDGYLSILTTGFVWILVKKISDRCRSTQSP